MNKSQAFLKTLHETGEPDQDYDHEIYDAICKSLKGYKCSHKEFDKYQGVYITASKGGKTAKIWTMDWYNSGIKDPASVSGSGTFSYKGKPSDILVMWIEDTPEDAQIEVRVSPEGQADVGELKAALDQYMRG